MPDRCIRRDEKMNQEKKKYILRKYEKRSVRSNLGILRKKASVVPYPGKVVGWHYWVSRMYRWGRGEVRCWVREYKPMLTP